MQTATAMLSDRPTLHALAKGWWLLLLRGIAAIVFGAAYSVVFGISFVALALRLKNHKHASTAAA